MTVSVLNMNVDSSYHSLSYANERQIGVNGTKSPKTSRQHEKLNKFYSSELDQSRGISKQRMLRKVTTPVIANTTSASYAQPIQKLNFQTVTLLTRDGAIPSKARQVKETQPEFYSQTVPIPAISVQKPLSFSPEPVSLSATDRLQKALINLTFSNTKTQKDNISEPAKLENTAKSHTEAQTDNELSLKQQNIKTVSSFSTPKNIRTTNKSIFEKQKGQTHRDYSHSAGELLKATKFQQNFVQGFSKSPKNVRFVEELEQNLLNIFTTDKAESVKKITGNKKLLAKESSSEKFAFSKSQVSPDPKNIPIPNFLKTVLEPKQQDFIIQYKQSDKSENKAKPLNAFLNALKKFEKNNE